MFHTESEKNERPFFVLSFLLLQEPQTQVQGSLILRASLLTSASFHIRRWASHRALFWELSQIQFQTAYCILTNYNCYIYLLLYCIYDLAWVSSSNSLRNKTMCLPGISSISYAFTKERRMYAVGLLFKESVFYKHH